ncbi:uncharacterized protein PV09_04650 [Verruconis gallopava]|uniref:Bud22 domain-containing protein n=1 Tax=Verruconis gallopava TaxID=253628 RepID=A0A0D1XP68_9PEZI|nr:uncharacterized protein PV09_04650 [Verruconis gallopava]KIW04366.1 hypothetical protein PV09_04650 [Verruconis gallopava]
MAKRKRNEYDEALSEDEDDNADKTLRLSKRIARGIQELTAALEQARRFERQKLGRREHDRVRHKRQKNCDNRVTQVEIASLKALDMNEIARKRLYKDLVKTPSIAKTGLLPEDVKLPAGGNRVDKATADVMARLFKQKGVVLVLDTIMTSIRQILGLQKSSGPAEKARREDSTLLEATNTLNENISVSSEEASDDDDNIEEDEDAEDEEGMANHGALASPSDSGSESEFNVNPVGRKPTTSTFLPSLSMTTGYISASDSDSEATDIEEHIAPRKNRRGQRARQAIWEKKYKDKARHLNKPKKKRDKRDEGWDLQRGAVSADDAKRKNRKFGHGKRAGNAVGDATPVKERKENKERHRDDVGALHPSWQAKKLMKERSMGIGEFKGKKVVFD